MPVNKPLNREFARRLDTQSVEKSVSVNTALLIKDPSILSQTSVLELLRGRINQHLLNLITYCVMK